MTGVTGFHVHGGGHLGFRRGRPVFDSGLSYALMQHIQVVMSQHVRTDRRKTSNLTTLLTKQKFFLLLVLSFFFSCYISFSERCTPKPITKDDVCVRS